FVPCIYRCARIPGVLAAQGAGRCRVNNYRVYIFMRWWIPPNTLAISDALALEQHNRDFNHCERWGSDTLRLGSGHIAVVPMNRSWESSSLQNPYAENNNSLSFPPEWFRSAMNPEALIGRPNSPTLMRGCAGVMPCSLKCSAMQSKRMVSAKYVSARYSAVTASKQARQSG